MHSSRDFDTSNSTPNNVSKLVFENVAFYSDLLQVFMGKSTERNAFSFDYSDQALIKIDRLGGQFLSLLSPP